MNEADQINHELWELWKKHREAAGDLAPKFVLLPLLSVSSRCLVRYPSFPKNLTEVHRQWIQKNTKLNYPRDFEWNQISNSFDVEMVKMHASVHHYRDYSWFKRLNDLAKTLEVEEKDYGHMDIYFWMDASSSEINCKVKRHGDFAKKQQHLTARLLEIHQPKLIVCVYKNAWIHFSKMEFLKIKKETKKRKLVNAIVEFGQIEISKKAIHFVVCPDLPKGRYKSGIKDEDLPCLTDLLKNSGFCKS